MPKKFTDSRFMKKRRIRRKPWTLDMRSHFSFGLRSPKRLRSWLGMVITYRIDDNEYRINRHLDPWTIKPSLIIMTKRQFDYLNHYTRGGIKNKFDGILIKIGRNLPPSVIE